MAPPTVALSQPPDRTGNFLATEPREHLATGRERMTPAVTDHVAVDLRQSDRETAATTGSRTSSVERPAVHRELRSGRALMADAGCLLDVRAAAERLGVTQRWVRRAVAERRISFVKVGRNVRFEPEAISRYIEQQRRPARDDSV